MQHRHRLGVVLLLALLLLGCKADQAFTVAARQAYDATIPEWIAYVDADASLTKEQRDRRHRTAELWSAAIAAREVSK